MLEVYNEMVRDLLHPDTPPKSISIRENPEGEILVIGVRDKPVKSAAEVMQWLETGSGEEMLTINHHTIHAYTHKHTILHTLINTPYSIHSHTLSYTLIHSHTLSYTLIQRADPLELQ
jgi:hypothetical protein